MAIPAARLNRAIASKTIKVFRQNSKLRATVSHSEQAKVDAGANTIDIPLWTDAAGSGADPAGSSELSEPSANVALTQTADRDSKWPDPRKSGIRLITLQLQQTSLQSGIINYLDEHTVPLSWIERERADQAMLIKQDIDNDIYAAIKSGVTAAEQITPEEVGVADMPKWDVSNGNYDIDSEAKLDKFGLAIDSYFESYIEMMTDIGAMDGDADADMEEFFSIMNIRTWNRYARYLRSKRIEPNLSLETLRDNTALGAGMARMVRSDIRLLTVRQVDFPANADQAFDAIVSYGMGCVEQVDGPGVTGLITPAMNQVDGPQWRLNQATSGLAGKVDPRTVRTLRPTSQA